MTKQTQPSAKMEEIQDILKEIPLEGDALESFFEVVIKNRERVEYLNKFLDEAKKSFVISTKDLLSKMSEQGIESFKSRFGHSVGKRNSIFFRVNKDDQGKQFDWLKSINAEDLIIETVNAGTFQSFVKSMMKDDPEKSLPEFIKTHEEVSLTIKNPLG